MLVLGRRLKMTVVLSAAGWRWEISDIQSSLPYMLWCCLSFIFSVVTTSTPERQEGVKLLEQALEKIKETIASYGGVFHTKLAVSLARPVSSTPGGFLCGLSERTMHLFGMRSHAGRLVARSPPSFPSTSTNFRLQPQPL